MDTYLNKLNTAKQFIIENDDFLVISHLHPDGDAIGSSLAVTHLLNNLNKTYTVVNEGECSERFSFLTGFEQIIDVSKHKLNRTFQTIIAVDVADFKRLGDVSHILAEETNVLNIDHHPTNTLFGNINLIRTDAASTTEILFDLIKTCFNEQLDKNVAEALYTGLLTDTGGYRYANTTQSVMEMGAYLLRYDIGPSKIAEYALETISASFLRLLKQSISTLSFAYDHKVAILSVSIQDMEEAEATKDDVDGLVSYPRNIEGVEVGVLLKEWEEGEVKVSLRSKQYVDVAAIAQRNGGGGHVKASGFTFIGTLTEAREHILKELEKVIGG